MIVFDYALMAFFAAVLTGASAFEWSRYDRPVAVVYAIGAVVGWVMFVGMILEA